MERTGPDEAASSVAGVPGPFGQVVVKHRLRLGLTQEALAELTGLSARRISEIESGRVRHPRNSTVILLAEAFGVRGAEREQFRRQAHAPPGHARPQTLVAQLPADLSVFVGRAGYLAQLDALLVAADGPPPTVLISAFSGMPGVGKTALAVHWAHRVADQFPDGQLYVDLRGFHPSGQIVEPAVAIGGFLSALGVPPERIPPDLDSQAGLYRSLLASKRLLVLLDNARDADHVRPLLPGAAGCLALITSRHHLTPLVARHGARVLTLDVLPVAEARDLLTARLGHERTATEPHARDQIITACARLPLALAISAARAQDTEFPLAAIAAELATEARRLDTLDAGDPASQVRAVFSWSYAALTEPGARLFRLLALHPGPDVSAPAAASLAACPATEARRLLTELTQASLLIEPAPGRYRFHDLVHDYATELALTRDTPDTRRAAAARLADHYTHTACTADRLIMPHRNPIPLPLSPHAGGAAPEHLADEAAAMTWLATEYPVVAALLGHPPFTGLDRQLWQLAWAIDTWLYRRGLWHDQNFTWTIALDAARALDHTVGQAYAYRMLASTDARLGRYNDGQQNLSRALHQYKRAADLIGQADTYHHIAYLWEQRGHPERALAPLQRALAINQATGRQREQANILNSIGWIHTRTGSHQDALTQGHQALDLFERLGDRVGMAITLDTLGHAHHDLRERTAAIDCYERSLALHTESSDLTQQAQTATHLGDTHLAAGNPAAAHAAWQHALNILEDLGHPAAGDVRTRLTHLDRNPESRSQTARPSDTRLPGSP